MVIRVLVRKVARKRRNKIPDLFKGLPKSLLKKVLCPFFINSGRRGMPLQIRELRMES